MDESQRIKHDKNSSVGGVCIYEHLPSMIDAHHGIAGKIAFHCAATFKLPLHIRSSQLGADPSNSPRMPETSYKKHEDLKPRLAWGGFIFFSPQVMSIFFVVESWPSTPKFLSILLHCSAKEHCLQVSLQLGRLAGSRRMQLLVWNKVSIWLQRRVAVAIRCHFYLHPRSGCVWAEALNMLEKVVLWNTTYSNIVISI